MAVQLIFCMETNKTAATDWIYIKETIDHYFEVNNQVKLNRVYMNTKTKYRSKDVLDQIKQKIKEFEIGQSVVIYCIDTDDFEKNADHERELGEIERFCKNNDYEMIWFCHNVEEVFWGHKVSDSKKVREAGVFRNKKKIQEISLRNLTSDRRSACKSNILLVLKKYLKEK